MNGMVNKMDMQYENNAVQKYNDIMQRYRNGEFGDNYLTLAQIMAAAGEPDFFENLTIEEIDELINQSTGMLRMFFAGLKEKTLNSGGIQKPLGRFLNKKDSNN